MRGFTDELAVFPRQRPGDIGLSTFQAFGELQQHLGSHPGLVCPRRRLERLACDADCGVGVGEPGVGESAKPFPGTRVPALGLGAPGRSDPLPADPVTSFQCHDVLRWFGLLPVVRPHGIYGG